MSKKLLQAIGIVSIFLFLALVFSVGIPSGATAGDTVKIVHLDPFSGPFAYVGELYNAGIRFAVKEQNEKGGLLGKKIELFSADSEVKPDVATRKAKKYILKEKVDLIGSGTGSHVLIALNKVATGYKKILINYGGMSDIVHGKEFSRYAFRVCQNSYNFTTALAQLMATTPYRKYYIVCQDYAWGHDVAKAFKMQMKKYMPDAQIVGEDYHPIATKDFGPYVTKVMASEADAVFTGNWGADGRLLIKQARSLGMKKPFVTTFGTDPTWEKDLGKAAVGVYHAYDYYMRVDTPQNRDFVKRYHEKIGKTAKDYVTWWPTGSTGHAAIGWKMAFAAIEKAGSLDPEKIIKAFEGFNYQSPVGLWHMRKCDHQVILPMFGGQITDEPNPYFNGSIDPKVNFPWMQKDVKKFDSLEGAIPATSDYNKRCQ